MTGGASGLGLATVRRLVAAGARVIVLDLPNAGDDGALRALGPAVCTVRGDVRNEAAVAAAVDRAAALGPLRLTVCCAGVAGGWSAARVRCRWPTSPGWSRST